MRTVTGLIRRPAAACWKTLTDPTTFTGWVPGLRRATVIETYPSGLAKEIHFELGSSLTYSLVYTYDVAAYEVRWTPRIGQRDAVAGFAKLEPVDDGTRVTYGLEPGAGRSEEERVRGDPAAVVAQLMTWLHAY